MPYPAKIESVDRSYNDMPVYRLGVILFLYTEINAQRRMNDDQRPTCFLHITICSQGTSKRIFLEKNRRREKIIAVTTTTTTTKLVSGYKTSKEQPCWYGLVEIRGRGPGPVL